MKRLMVLFCAILVVFPFVMTGCGGVAEADYDAVVAERDALQTENSALQAEIDALEANMDDLVTELTAAQSELTALVDALDAKLTAVLVMKDYFAGALDYIAGGMSESEAQATLATFVAEFGDLLDDVGNEEVSQLWDEAQAAAAIGDLIELVAKVTEIMDLLQDLIEDDMAAIEAGIS
jgi:outer membrane murein-binding lipoprotein Lpp